MKAKHIITLLAGIGLAGAAIALAPQKSTVPGLYPPPGYGVTNPDITQANIQDNICNKNWSTKSIRPPSSYTSTLKIQQLKNIGYSDQTTGDYEEDHLISLELGGNPTDPKNLWPESYKTTPNARDKDKAEGYLHRQVCSGAMTLLEAQTAIKTDWVKVYHSMKSGNLGSIQDEVSTSDDE